MIEHLELELSQEITYVPTFATRHTVYHGHIGAFAIKWNRSRYPGDLFHPEALRQEGLEPYGLVISIATCCSSPMKNKLKQLAWFCSILNCFSYAQVGSHR